MPGAATILPAARGGPQMVHRTSFNVRDVGQFICQFDREFVHQLVESTLISSVDFTVGQHFLLQLQ
jgi:hypothetical protein